MNAATCNISLQSEKAFYIIRADVIIWDELPMSHRFLPEALDTTLRDLMKTEDPRLEEVPFGGKVVEISGKY